jgi:hypothetical protein
MRTAVFPSLRVFKQILREKEGAGEGVLHNLQVLVKPSEK